MQITRQKLYSILRKAGYQSAKFTRSGMVRGWGSWSAGVQVLPVGINGIDWRIEYVFYGHATEAARVERLQAIQKALISAGVECYPNTQETAIIIGSTEA